MSGHIGALTSHIARLLFRQLIHTNKKETSKFFITCPVWGESHGWPVDPSHKAPVMRALFPLHDTIPTRSRIPMEKMCDWESLP